MNKKIALLPWKTEYNEAAIYSLVDQSGKRYIGQALHLQERLKTHMQELNRIANNTDCYTTENVKLYEAVQNGAIFRVKILYYFPYHKITINNLRFYENYYLQKFGGLDNTYNVAPVPPPCWNHKEFNKVLLK